MSQTADSQILKLRTLAVPGQYRQMVAKIFDKKLKSYLVLETREEVLGACQELLIAKTIDYMNLVDQLETKQLTLLNTLNVISEGKTSLITELQGVNQALREQISQKQTAIGFLSRDLEETRKTLAQSEIKLQKEVACNLDLIREQDKRINALRSQYFAVRSDLQTLNKELSRNLDQKTGDLKLALETHKDEITALKFSKEMDAMEFNRKIKEAQVDFQNVKEELTKDKKYLQDLVEVKEDQIVQAKKPKPKRLRQEQQFSLTIQLQKQIQDVKHKQKSESNSRTRSKNKQKQSQVAKSNAGSVSNTISLRDTQFVDNQPHFVLILKQMGVQCTEQEKSKVSKGPQPARKPLASTASQTVNQDPTQAVDQMTDLEVKLKDFMEEKYRLLYDEKLKGSCNQVKVQYRASLRQAQAQMSALSRLTNQRIDVYNQRISEIELVYQERPSRQQDLDYIRQLISQNGTLVALCSQANQKTDAAYMALHEYHNQLQSYKRTSPIKISGTMPPRIHSYKDIKDTKDNLNEIYSSLKDTRTFKNTKLNSLFSIGLTEPRQWRVRTKQDDDFFETTMKEVLITEYDNSQLLFSPAKKRKGRPQTGANLKGFRKRSVM